MLGVNSYSVTSQEFNCQQEFAWVKKTFTENDAGFDYTLSVKGESAYRLHTENIEQSLKNTDIIHCEQLIKEWLVFFRGGHWSIRQITTDEKKVLSDEEIREKFKNWPTLDIDVDKFKKKHADKKSKDYEGVWSSPPYVVGIKKMDNSYTGFIIDSESPYWSSKQVKLTIDGQGKALFYYRDHSEGHFDRVEMIGNNHLLIGDIHLARLDPIEKDSEEIERYFRLLNSDQPFFEILDKNTSYIRIPSFSSQYRHDINKVISDNKEHVMQRENLLIDIRYNGGGSDSSYKPLLPFLYTNPIRTVGVEFLSTPLNNKRMIDFITDPSYNLTDDEKKWAKDSFDNLSSKLGEFVSLNEMPVDITEYAEVLPKPNNIAILINHANGSTAEQFLLAAKQSKKVKLFGTTTAGVLDISNMYFVDSPSGNYKLGYSLSKSKRIPHMTIDEKGIQPDYYIDPTIKEYQWIEFVRNTLKDW